MKDNIGVQHKVVRPTDQRAGGWSRRQWRLCLMAFFAHWRRTGNVISQIMLTHNLENASLLVLLEEGLCLQHDGFLLLLLLLLQGDGRKGHLVYSVNMHHVIFFEFPMAACHDDDQPRLENTQRLWCWTRCYEAVVGSHGTWAGLVFYSLFFILYSLFLILYSLFVILYSLFFILLFFSSSLLLFFYSFKYF
jgi:hypothetical protein